MIEQAWPIAAASSGGGGGPAGGGGGSGVKVAAVVAAGAAVIALVAWGILAFTSPPPAPPLTPVASPPPVVALAPAELTLSTEAIDLGLEGESGVVALGNAGDLGVRVEAHPSAGWLTVDPAVVSVDPGAVEEIVVRVDRSALPPGVSTAVVDLVTKGETRQITVRVERPVPAVPPRVGAPAVVRIDCSGAPRTVTVRVPVTADAALSSVDLTWSSTAVAGGSPMSGTSPMSPADGAWVVTLGPFTGPVSVTMSARAVDVRGLAGQGPTATATLDSCS